MPPYGRVGTSPPTRATRAVSPSPPAAHAAISPPPPVARLSTVTPASRLLPQLRLPTVGPPPSATLSSSLLLPLPECQCAALRGPDEATARHPHRLALPPRPPSSIWVLLLLLVRLLAKPGLQMATRGLALMHGWSYGSSQFAGIDGSTNDPSGGTIMGTTDGVWRSRNHCFDLKPSDGINLDFQRYMDFMPYGYNIRAKLIFLCSASHDDVSYACFHEIQHCALKFSLMVMGMLWSLKKFARDVPGNSWKILLTDATEP